MALIKADALTLNPILPFSFRSRLSLCPRNGPLILGDLGPLDHANQAHLQGSVDLQMHVGWSQHKALLKYPVTGGVGGLSDKN